MGCDDLGSYFFCSLACLVAIFLFIYVLFFICLILQVLGFLCMIFLITGIGINDVCIVCVQSLGVLLNLLGCVLSYFSVHVH